MRSLLTIALLSAALPAFASETGRPSGQNCDLTAPPEGAGEEFDHGTPLRVYPRTMDMGGKYSGCQVRWIADKDRWTLVGVVALVSGEPVRLWSPDVAAVTCLYDKGKLVQGDTRSCPDVQALILKSRPAGCVEKMRGGGIVPGCEAQ